MQLHRRWICAGLAMSYICGTLAVTEKGAERTSSDAATQHSTAPHTNEPLSSEQLRLIRDPLQRARMAQPDAKREKMTGGKARRWVQLDETNAAYVARREERWRIEARKVSEREKKEQQEHFAQTSIQLPLQRTLKEKRRRDIAKQGDPNEPMPYGRTGARNVALKDGRPITKGEWLANHRARQLRRVRRCLAKKSAQKNAQRSESRPLLPDLNLSPSQSD